MSTVVVVDYDDAWPRQFEALAARIWPAVQDVALSIEHIGSTSVPGLAAKPIIDMCIVVPSSTDIPIVIGKVAALGYRHRGNLGIEGREAFHQPPDLPRHPVRLPGRDSRPREPTRPARLFASKR